MKTKTIIIFLLIMFFILPQSIFLKAQAFTNAEAVIHNDIEEILNDFIKNNPNRDAGTLGEYNSAEYLEQIFKANLLQPLDEKKGFIQRFLNENGVGYSKSQNVVGIKRGKNSDENIIISTNYDNKYLTTKSVGAKSNGLGVTTLIYLLQNLKDKVYDFDIIFIAFGNSESLSGCKHFINDTPRKYIDNCKLMINLEGIGAGENVTIYADEVKTIHEKLFLDSSKKFNLKLKTPPRDRQINYLNKYIAGIPYSHLGMNDENSIFLYIGKNAISFIGYDWSNSSFGNKYETKNDNLDSLKKEYPNYSSSIFDTCKIIEETIGKDNFLAELNRSASQKFNYYFLISESNSALIGIFILLIFTILTFIIYNNEKNNIYNIKKVKKMIVFSKELDGTNKKRNK